MKLELFRQPTIGDATPGQIELNGSFECFSLEDVVRSGDKIFGRTAIPAGLYEVVITWSPHFQRRLPLLVGVPNYQGVRIHPGNTAADTDGCILVGTQQAGATVLNSKVAFDRLFEKLDQAMSNSDMITINIRDEQRA